MQDQAYFYPVRTVSRSVARRSAKRTSWFVLGTGFGMACALALTSTSPLPFSFYTNQAPTLSLSLVEKEVQELSTTKGINVVALALPPVAPTAKALAPAPAAQPQAVEAARPPAAEAPEKPAPEIYPLMLDLKVGDGDTLLNILTDTGVTPQEAHQAINSVRPLFNPRKLDIGQSISVTLDKPEGAEAPVITTLSVPLSNVAHVQVTRKVEDGKAGFAAKEIKEELFRHATRAGGVIDSSLYETGAQKGIPASVLGELINAYSYDVDFQRDIQPGDTIDVLFDRLQTKEGEVADIGNVLYAQLTTGGKSMKIYRHADKSGMVDYYNEKGESVRKALLRTPINGAKITSRFGKRVHPILGYTKIHRGVDFGAPTGTPIYAAGDGTVTYAGRKGTYGNYLKIKHDKKYSSAYAHISRFASGMSPGKKVKQGQIIAYVGTTGNSTGPHLHYEILVNNVQVNPSGVKFKTGNVLAGKELASFKQNVAQIQAQLKNGTAMNVAMAQ